MVASRFITYHDGQLLRRVAEASRGSDDHSSSSASGGTGAEKSNWLGFSWHELGTINP